MIPLTAIQRLVSQGYMLISYGERYVSAIKEINGQDRYVLLKYEDGHFFVISN